MTGHRDLNTFEIVLPLNCPRCGVRLIYAGCANKVQFYTCVVHGEHWLDVDGHFRSARDTANSASSNPSPGVRD
jgi:hypothetical protein